jgi:hypothetical protein
VGEQFIYNNTLYKATSAIAKNATITIGGNASAADSITSQISKLSNYSTSETDTGQQWIDGKTIYRKVINFGALANTGTKSVNHGISSISQITKLYAISYNSHSSPKNWSMIPAANPDVQYSMALWIDATKVYIKSGDDRTYQTPTYVIVEYTK